jgi:hypothetical protein
MRTPITPEWAYQDADEAKKTFDHLAKTGVNGFVLVDCPENADKIIAFIKDLGDGTHYNGKTVDFAVRSLAQQLQWQDIRRRLKNGELALDKDADELALRSASTEQLRDVLKASRPKQEEHLQPWDLPLLFVAEGGTLTKKQFIDAEPKALRSWITRRRIQGLGTAYVE